MKETFPCVQTKTIQSKDGNAMEFGSHQLAVQVHTLLSKFKDCYDLYNANHPLCTHEVEMMTLRCSSFGCWFPVSFPTQNLKQKFHLLTVDVPKQARRLQTTGMITEQTIESIHPYINELDRRFAKVADETQKGHIIMKQQNMYSQPSWNALKSRKHWFFVLFCFVYATVVNYRPCESSVGLTLCSTVHNPGMSCSQ